MYGDEITESLKLLTKPCLLAIMFLDPNFRPEWLTPDQVEVINGKLKE